MSIIRLLGGVTRDELAELREETQALKEQVQQLSLGPPADPDVQAARNAAQSAQQDANSAANSAASAATAAAAAAGAVDGLNESLANHATELGALDGRVTVLESGVLKPEPNPEPQPAPIPDLSLRGRQHPPPLTGAEAVHAGAAAWYAANPNEHLDRSVANLADRDDAYEYRHLRDRISNTLLSFRRIEDLHLLDAVTTWLGLCRRHLRVGYRDHDPSVVTWPASPYRMWPSKSGMPPNLRGTDLQVMNEVKWAATIAEVAYALHLNRDLVSPGGLNYAQEADFWHAWLVDDFVPKWSGGGVSGWRQEYRGVRRHPTYYSREPGVGPQRYGRATAGHWPVAVNGGDMHSSISSMLLAHFVHLLTGSDTALGERDWLAGNLVNVEMVRTPSPGGQTLVLRQAWRSQGSDTELSLRATYVGYVCSDLVTAHLEGIPHITREVLTEFTRAVRHFLWLPGVTDTGASAALTRPDILGGVNRAGIQTHGSPRTQAQALNFSLLTIAAWDETGFLEREADRLHGLGWSGGWSTPKTLAATAGRLLRAALT